jgi:hypothetical protein
MALDAEIAQVLSVASRIARPHPPDELALRTAYPALRSTLGGGAKYASSWRSTAAQVQTSLRSGYTGRSKRPVRTRVRIR